MRVVQPLAWLALVVSPGAHAFLGHHPPAGRWQQQQPLFAAKVGLYYSSSTGNTETVGGYIAKAAGGGLDLVDIGDAKDEEIMACDSIICGAPTWHTGADEQRSGTSWDEWLYSRLPNLDLTGKKVAVFGVGDSESYADYYCDAAAELHELFLAKGATMCGYTSTEGYHHQSSKAEIESGKFCGAMFDEDNQYDLSENRANKWVEQLKGEGFF